MNMAQWEIIEVGVGSPGSWYAAWGQASVPFCEDSFGALGVDSEDEAVGWWAGQRAQHAGRSPLDCADGIINSDWHFSGPFATRAEAEECVDYHTH